MLFDGNAIVHRAYHAFAATKYRQEKPLTVSKTGELVNAVFGFTSMLLKVLNDMKPTHIASLLIKKARPSATKCSTSIKPTAPPCRKNWPVRWGGSSELVKDFSIPVYEMEKFEADDVLGTLTTGRGARHRYRYRHRRRRRHAARLAGGARALPPAGKPSAIRCCSTRGRQRKVRRAAGTHRRPQGARRRPFG